MYLDTELFVKKRDSIYRQLFTTVPHTVRLHRGRIYWTEGSGRTAKRHDSLFVFKSSLLPKKNGIVLDCYEEIPGGEPLRYQFTYWYGILNGSLYHYITIARNIGKAEGEYIFTGFYLLL